MSVKSPNEDLKLWFHFADIDEEEEAEEIEGFVNKCYGGQQAASHAVDTESGEVQWLLLEASSKAEPDDTLVASARLVIYIPPSLDQNAIEKKGCVDVLCVAGDDEKIFKYLVNKVEMVAYNAGVEKLVINIPDWRMDQMETLLNTCGYEERSGFLLEQSFPSATGFIKSDSATTTKPFVPTMIMEFHKKVDSVYEKKPATKTVTIVEEGAAPSAASILGDLSGLSISEICVSEVDTDSMEGTSSNAMDLIASLGSQGGSGMESLIEDLFSALHADVSLQEDATADPK
jgi:hypothetical protein